MVRNGTVIGAGNLGVTQAEKEAAFSVEAHFEVGSKASQCPANLKPHTAPLRFEHLGKHSTTLAQPRVLPSKEESWTYK